MAKSVMQKFVDFKKRNSLSNAVIIKMAKEYANSDDECSMSYFADKYNISKSAFHKARDYAIICCLLDEVTYEKIKKKSSGNYRRNNPKNKADGSIKHFDYLKEQRKAFLETFTEKEIKDIACKYISGLAIDKIAVAYDTGEYAIKLLLYKGIVNLVIDKETVEEISKKLGTKITEMLTKRSENKKKLLACIENEITVINFQIKNYNLYYSGIKNKPTLKTLQDKLIMLEKRQEIIRNK